MMLLLLASLLLLLVDKPLVTLPSLRCVDSKVLVRSFVNRASAKDFRPHSHRDIDLHYQCSCVPEKDILRRERISSCMIHPRLWSCEIALSTKQNASSGEREQGY